MTKPFIETLRAAAAYLREEADFNRSWVDGRRNARGTDTDGYVARRLELAAERDAWAEAIEEAANRASQSEEQGR